MLFLQSLFGGATQKSYGENSRFFLCQSKGDIVVFLLSLGRIYILLDDDGSIGVFG